MTRKVFSFQEVCTNDDLNAIVDDCVINQMIATWPFSELNTAIVSKVVGAPPAIASDESDSLIIALPIVPLRGDFVRFRYEYKNATTQNASITIDYLIYDLSSGELLTTISKTKTLQASKTAVTDVLDLGDVGGKDLSGTSVLIKMHAYWPGAQNWFNALKRTAFDGAGCCWITVISRPNDNGIYVFGTNRQYSFWDTAHAADTWSADRNTGVAWSCRAAYHPGYGVMVVGYDVTNCKSAKIRNDVDHYTDGANSAETDVLTITGLGSPPGVLNNFEIDVCRDGNRFVAINAKDHGSAPFATAGSIIQNTFSPIGGSPAWGGAAVQILNGAGSDEWIPESTAGHPAGAGLDPRVLDVYVMSDNPTSGGTLHYFVRYQYNSAGTMSTGVIYQKGTTQFELLTDLNSWYEHGNTTYPEYGYICPGVNPKFPSQIGLAVWEHKKIAANNHELRLRILTKNFVANPGWTWRTVHTITGLTDADLANHGFNSTASLGKGNQTSNMQLDYGFDRDGVEHVVYSRYDSVSGHRQVYYRKHILSTFTWTTEVKISTGTDWDNFDDGGLNSMYALGIQKDNGYVPLPGPELRVAWTARSFLLNFATFIAGVRVSSGEDNIEVYAPEVFMGYRDTTAGPKDMLWP